MSETISSQEANARKRLTALLADYHKLSDTEKAGMTEASVVRQFIDRLFEEVLGWPIKDAQRYKYEHHTSAGRPDIMFTLDSGEILFVEAKRFGAIKPLEQSRTTITGAVTPGQLALPGMAVDRTPEEQQAINYAFQNNGKWAILTNFEKLRLFNARRDWLVLSFEATGDYLTDFNWLWELSYERILNGSLDAMSNQRHTEDVDQQYLNFINIWREKLALDVLAHQAENAWLFGADGRVDLARLRFVVQRYLDRLVIIRFAEDHLIIPVGTLRSFYEIVRINPYTFKLYQFMQQFARQFDSQHNSALFAPDITDHAVFGDATLLPLIEKLYEARYRAMPADILGNTYEQYLGKTLTVIDGAVKTRDNFETRKKQGSYYTPQVIVRYIVDHSLGRALYGTANGKPDGDPLPGETRKTSADVRGLRVLDSACGSGSFLIYAYYVLAEFYERELERLKAEQLALIKHLASAETALDERIAAERIDLEIRRIQEYPRLILETHLYGVDLDPQAAEIAVVNLMMRGMERRGVYKRLPLILNQNVKVGNGLIGLRPDDPRMAEHAPALRRILDLRARLVATPHGAEHDQIIRDLDALTTATRAALDAHLTPHFTDLERVRPFHWGLEFPEVFYAADGTPLPESGFAIIVGNPPWEIVKPDLREYYAQFDAEIESRLNRTAAETRIAQLDAADANRRVEFSAQTAAIEQMSAFVRRTADYQHQGRGDTATHKLFLERMYTLLRTGGRIGYVVPSGIYTDLGTKDLRGMLLEQGSIEYIFSFSNERYFFPGVHHAFKFCLIGAHKGGSSDGFWAAFRFNPRVAVKPDDLPAFLENRANLVYIKTASVKRFSPDSLSVMEFQSERDYTITEKLFDSNPLLGSEVAESWNVKLAREFDMTLDRSQFNQTQNGYPLYEGKMIHQYNSFFSEPSYWVTEQNIQARFKNRVGLSGERDSDLVRLGFREISQATNERTVIASIIPPHTACNHKISIISPSLSKLTNAEMLFCLSVLNSFTLDYVARFKITTGVSMFHFYQLPVPRLQAGEPAFDALVPLAARLTCTRPEFADLWRDVMGSAWDESSGVSDPAARQRIRDEIDARVAHLYGLTRAEFDHILGTFPLVFPDSEAGRARRSALLSAYDALTPTN